MNQYYGGYSSVPPGPPVYVEKTVTGWDASVNGGWVALVQVPTDVRLYRVTANFVGVPSSPLDQVCLGIIDPSFQLVYTLDLGDATNSADWSRIKFIWQAVSSDLPYFVRRGLLVGVRFAATPLVNDTIHMEACYR